MEWEVIILEEGDFSLSLEDLVFSCCFFLLGWFWLS